jgi:hypothetical protein
LLILPRNDKKSKSMFSKAYKISSQYTHPLLISNRFYDGTVTSGVGSFVIINKEGWIATAGHILDSLLTYHKHQAEIEQYNAKTGAKIDPKWISNHSIWFGADHHFIRQFHILGENDLAIGKIENYNPDFVKTYPVFKDPRKLEPGTSLCKLGYPFYDVKATFDEKNNQFRFDPSVFPIPSFPIDGIYTRNIITGKSPDGKFDYKFLETSTPGLRGQSGGPTFDKDGKIWAIQSQTHHLPLGFSPTIKKDDKEIEENQFLNVGWGVHVEAILRFLDEKGVKYQVD